MELLFNQVFYDRFLASNKGLFRSIRKGLPNRLWYLVELGEVAVGLRSTDSLLKNSQHRFFRDQKTKTYPLERVEKHILLKRLLPEASDERFRDAGAKAFEAIEIIVNGSKVITQNKIDAVHFLERCVEVYFPFLAEGLRIVPRESRLQFFRKKSKKQYNTLCHKCGRPLRRSASIVVNKSIEKIGYQEAHIYKPSYCYQSESRRCADDKIGKKEISKEYRNLSAPCNFCGYYFLNLLPRTIHQKQYHFCSEKHYQSMRREIVRNKGNIKK